MGTAVSSYGTELEPSVRLCEAVMGAKHLAEALSADLSEWVQQEEP